jgi:hypothetical protein
VDPDRRQQHLSFGLSFQKTGPANFASRHPDAMRPHRWPAVDHLFSRLDHVPAALVGKMTGGFGSLAGMMAVDPFTN